MIVRKIDYSSNHELMTRWLPDRLISLSSAPDLGLSQLDKGEISFFWPRLAEIGLPPRASLNG